MPPAEQLTVPQRASLPTVAVPRLAARARPWLAAGVVLALAALSFAFPSAPTYDPWAWIIWGREVLHLDLSTVDGPSWKPLPVVLTTPFALAGDLAPDLWLFVARAGALAGVVLAFRLATRVGRTPVAGAAAAAAYLVAPWTIRNGALGNSEGLLVALALGAVDQHLAGRRRVAFGLGLGVALLRPEAWGLLGLYGLWLLWRAPQARAVVLAGLTSLPVLWLAPEWWGSGDALRAAHRAQKPNANSAAFAEDPIRAVLEQFGQMLATPVWVGLALLIPAALVARPGRGGAKAAAVIAGAGLIWVVEVAVMTSDGFSGNQRYLILPAALACVLAGVALGWLVRAVPPRAVPVMAVAAAVLFAAPTLHRIDPLLHGLRYQAHLTDGLTTAVAQAGGRERLLACGDPYAGNFQVPAVAWELRLHTSQVGLEPRRPAVVFRARNTSRSRPLPAVEPVGGEGAVDTLAIAGGWRILGACR